MRLATRDLRHRPAEAALLGLALTAATATLTLGLVLRGVTNRPYEQTRITTLGPDVVAEGAPPAVGRRPADLAALNRIEHSRGVAASGGPYPLGHVTLVS